ncbi:MAG: hypothetical protein KGS72_16760 [Cyanobacteria bacterium REEB67]|nr:hypothetical protein [Cyanobacteria bacterium REEB67]
MNRKDSIKDYLLAGNTETSPVKLSRLSHSRYVRIRCRVAENPAASRALLLALSGDLEADVRIAVANNPNAPQSLLAYLAADSCVDVRYALAENYQLPPRLLRKLAEDENPYVAARAQRTLKPNAFFRLISASLEGHKLISLKLSQFQAKSTAQPASVCRLNRIRSHLSRASFICLES